MPAMPRPEGLAKQIAFSILGTPPNMSYKKYSVKKKRFSGSTPSNPSGQTNERNRLSFQSDFTTKPVSTGMMGGGYL